VGGVGQASKAAEADARPVIVERTDSFFERARDAAGGRGFDVIFESVGGRVLAAALAEVAPGGTVVSYGAASGETDPRMPEAGELRARNATVAGFSILNLTRSRPEETARLLSAAIELAEDISLPAPRIVTWDGLIEAHLAQSEGRSTGKTVLRVFGH
jgi:NADPH:quinone reductase-like Zn-dependent oxidoreductase